MEDARRGGEGLEIPRVPQAFAMSSLSGITRLAGRFFGAGGGHPRILLLNDTRDQNNWGSVALTEAFIAILREVCPDMELRSVPSISLWTSTSSRGATTMVLPALADDYEDTAAVWQAGEGGREADAFIRQVQWADLVIYNGEGSIYRRNHSAMKALFMSWYARKILGKPCVYLNGGLHLTHVEPFLPPMARRTLLGLDAVTIRESWSLACAREFIPGLQAELVPDSVFYYACRPDGTTTVGARPPDDLPSGPYFCVAGGQMPHSLVRGKEAPLCRLIQALQRKGLRAIILAREDGDQYLARVAELCGCTFYGRDLSVNHVLGILRSAALQLTGRYHHFIFGALSGVPSIGFAAMSHKVQGVAELFGPLLKPVRNSTMLGMEWEETLAQAEEYLTAGPALREQIANRARELGELTRRYGAIVASLHART
jgi:polysaccharide pyruvyl transferase WcaK-like protein